MSQPPLDNKTDFAAHPQLLVDRDGEQLVTIVKASFELQDDGSLELAPPSARAGSASPTCPGRRRSPRASRTRPTSACSSRRPT